MDEAVSLSINIEEDVHDNFETFAKLYRYGHFAEARTWFDDCFGASSWKESFPLAAELAKCLLEQGDFEALARLVAEAQHLFHGPESRLMELLKVLAEFKSLDDQGLDKSGTRRLRDASTEASRVLFEQTTSGDALLIGLHNDVVGGPSFELGVQLSSTTLRVAQSLKELSPTLPLVWEHKTQFWDGFRLHFTSALAKRDFTSAQELLVPLLSLLDSAQARQIFQEFTNAVNSWSKEVKSHLDDKWSGNPTSDYILAMEPTWLAMAAAITQYCQYLSVEAANHTSYIPFGKQRRIKEIWLWLHRLGQVLMHLELCNKSVVDSRPGLLYNLQVLNTQRLEGRQHSQADEADIVASAQQQQDMMLERIVEGQRKGSPPTPPTSHKSAGFLLDLFLPLTAGTHLPGELRWTVSTIRDLLWQLCLIILQVTTFIGLLPVIMIYPGLIAIPVCVSATLILLKLSSLRHGPATTASSMGGQLVPESQAERWVFVSGTFTTASLFQSNVDAVSVLFSRSVFGIQGRRRGWLVDFLQDYASQRFGVSSRQTDLAYEHLETLSTDPTVDRIVLIAHGSGGIAVSQALSKLFLHLGPSYCSKFQIYTFGSMAKTMYNPNLSPISTASPPNPDIDELADPTPQRAFRTIEHYCNSNDPIARMGILQGLEQREDQLRGTVFLFDGASGHFFAQHYLSYLLRLKDNGAYVSTSSRGGQTEIILPSTTTKQSRVRDGLARDEPLWISTASGNPWTPTRTDKHHGPLGYARLSYLKDESKFLSYIGSGDTGYLDAFETSRMPSPGPSG